MGHLDQAVKIIRLLGVLFFLQNVLPIYADNTVEKLKQRACAVSFTAKGWCSTQKMLSLLDLVLEVKPKVYVEIGVFGGASILPAIYGVKFLGEGKVIAIDPWNKEESIKYLDPVTEKEHIDWWGNVKFNEIYQEFLYLLFLYELEDFCTVIRSTSEMAVGQIKNIDILHIDGNRAAEQSIQDVRLYLPKVNPGGYVWMGDCLGYNKQKAIELLMQQCDVIKIIDDGNCILFRKHI